MKKLISILVLLLSYVAQAQMDSIGWWSDRYGLVAHWRFNENAANKIVADNISTNTGTSYRNTSVMYTNSAPAGTVSAFNFVSGSADYVLAGNNPPIKNLTNNFTLACWFKVRAFASGGHWLHMFGKDVSGARSFCFGIYTLSIAPSTKNLFWIENGALPFDQGGTALSVDGLWHHAALVKDRPVTRFYLDGVLDYMCPTNSGIASNSTANLYLGKREYSGYQEYFNGLLDDMRIYNRALSPNEILNIYKGGTGTEFEY